VLEKTIKEQEKHLLVLESQTKAFSVFFEEHNTILMGLNATIVDSERCIREVEDLLAKTSMTVTGHDMELVDFQGRIQAMEMGELMICEDIQDMDQMVENWNDQVKIVFMQVHDCFNEVSRHMEIMADLIMDINNRLIGEVHCSHCPGFHPGSPSVRPWPSRHPDDDADLANKIEDELNLGDSSDEKEEEEGHYVPGSPISVQSQPYVLQPPVDDLGTLVPIDLGGVGESMAATTPEPIGEVILPVVRGDSICGKCPCPDLFTSGPCPKHRCYSGPDRLRCSSYEWHLLSRYILHPLFALFFISHSPLFYL